MSFCFMNIYTSERKWGKFEKFHQNKPCTIKLIYVDPNPHLRLQYDDKRAEFWKTIKGAAVVELNDKPLTPTVGETIIIP